MDKPRSCGCKGCRTCLVCERNYGISAKTFEIDKEKTYILCPLCKNKAWPGYDLDDYKTHPNHSGTCILFPGIYIELDFLTANEETTLLEGIEKMPWELSQSGRRKQNFGPKCNFKKNKLKTGNFNGFPQFSRFVQEKFATVDILKDFKTIEQCSLEYDPLKGASIDPHIDDCWVWGERIVTVNLLSDSVLTMTFNSNKTNYYNLKQVETYKSVLNGNGAFNLTQEPYEIQTYEPDQEYPIVRIPMPNRSLLVMYNSARYDWEHRILREDIKERRICLAYREFTPPFLPEGTHFEEAEEVLQRAQNFF